MSAVPDIVNLLEDLQCGERWPSRSRSSRSSSSGTDASIDPLVFKAHVPTEERRIASTAESHFFRGYKRSTDQLCHVIDQAGRKRRDLNQKQLTAALDAIDNNDELTEEERTEAKKVFLNRFEHKILRLRSLGVVDEKFHINSATNLLMMNSQDHLIFDKSHGFVIVLCEEDAVVVVEYLKELNALRQAESDRGERVGALVAYGLTETLYTRRKRREWRYEVVVIRPEEMGDPDPSYRGDEQWSIWHPLDGPGQYHMKENHFVSIADGTPLNPIPDIRFIPHSSPPDRDHTNTLNPLLVALNTFHKVNSNPQATPSLPALPALSAPAQRLIDLNNDIILELLVKVRVLSVKAVAETSTGRSVTPTQVSPEAEDHTTPKQKTQEKGTRPSGNQQQRNEGKGMEQSQTKGTEEPGLSVLFDFEGRSEKSSTYIVTGSGEDEPMFLNPNIPLEYRKQLLLRDLFGESSFGTSEDL